MKKMIGPEDEPSDEELDDVSRQISRTTGRQAEAYDATQDTKNSPGQSRSGPPEAESAISQRLQASLEGRSVDKRGYVIARSDQGVLRGVSKTTESSRRSESGPKRRDITGRAHKRSAVRRLITPDGPLTHSR